MSNYNVIEKTNNKLWNEFLQFVKDNLDEQIFNSWFPYATFLSFENKKLRIMVPTNYFYEYLEEHFSQLIRTGVKKIFGPEVQLKYIVKPDNMQETTYTPISKTIVDRPLIGANKAPNINKDQQDFPSQLYPEYTFETFIQGDSNMASRTIGMDIAEKFQDAFNPMFIFGPSGVGKTHLANAIGIRAKELHPSKKVLYTSAHLLQVQYTDAIRTNKFIDFMNFYQHIDVLIVDDIQEISGKKGTQEAFFNIFNHLQHNHKQLIITCDRPPVDLDGIEERLLSRFKWGFVAELEKPNAKLRKDILLYRIKRDGLPFTPSVVNYIVSNVNSSIRELEGVVTSIMAQSVVYSCDITIDLASKTIARTIKTNQEPPTTEKIVNTICHYYKISTKDIYSASRKKIISQARQISMYLVQKHTKLSTSQIGSKIGNRDHSTVLHACSQTEKRISVDKVFRAEIESIERNILN